MNLWPGRKSSLIYEQSAVIPYRQVDGELEVLLITARGNKRWIIPKGLIEPGLSPASSAAKEALEEAGVVGTVGQKVIGDYAYNKWGGTCHVQVYSLAVSEVHEQWEEQVFRARQWLPLHQAAAKVKEKELRQILLSLPAKLATNSR